MNYFFILDGKKLEFLGARGVDTQKFAKDLSGRFFREWVKNNFKLSKRDVENVVCWSGSTTIKDVADMLSAIE